MLRLSIKIFKFKRRVITLQGNYWLFLTLVSGFFLNIWLFNIWWHEASVVNQFPYRFIIHHKKPLKYVMVTGNLLRIDIYYALFRTILLTYFTEIDNFGQPGSNLWWQKMFNPSSSHSHRWAWNERNFTVFSNKIFIEPFVFLISWVTQKSVNILPVKIF